MKRLKELRIQRGLTQTQIGDLIGVSCVTVGRYEAGEREPSKAKISALADFFGVTIDYLMGRDEPDAETQNAKQVLWQKERDLLEKMTPEQRERVNEYMRFVLSQEKEKRGP